MVPVLEISNLSKVRQFACEKLKKKKEEEESRRPISAMKTILGGSKQKGKENTWKDVNYSWLMLWFLDWAVRVFIMLFKIK